MQNFIKTVFAVFLFVCVTNKSDATITFANENSRILLKDSNARLRFNQTSVNGWQDRSVTKQVTGRGLGDYNIVSYGGGDKIITFSEAPTELVYNNSNAIVKITDVSTTLPINNSNAVVYLSTKARNDSNAFAYGIKNNSNAIVKLSTTSGTLPINNSNSVKYLSDHFISVNNGKLTVLGGINGTTNIAGRSLLSSPIDLQGGTLTLNSDMILSNQTTVISSGNFDLLGNSMIFGGNLTLPTNVIIKVVSSGVLDGQGNEFKNAIGSKLIVDSGVTVTLRNLNWLASGSPQIEMRSPTSKLTLQNVAFCFDRDYSFTQGQLFIQDDVFVTGTNKFSYTSTQTSYIAPHSTLYFDRNTTFSYSPRLTSRHTLSERNLIKMTNKTSELYFNECTLQLPDSGWQVTNGTVYFDNKVTIYANTTQEASFELGNGTASGEVDVQVLSGAWLDNCGYIYLNTGI